MADFRNLLHQQDIVDQEQEIADNTDFSAINTNSDRTEETFKESINISSNEHLPQALATISNDIKKRQSWITSADIDDGVDDSAYSEDMATRTEFMSGTSSSTVKDLKYDIFGGHDTATVLSSKLEHIESLEYTKLKKWWIQELNCPELLPFENEIVSNVLESIADQESAIDGFTDSDKHHTTGNVNIDSLFASLLRIDTERVKFLLSDLLKLRLHKIERYPIFHVKNEEMRERLSRNELEFLKNYGIALEKHLQRTVLDHIPQNVFKKLDDDNMVDSPDLNQFVFVVCVQNIVFQDIERKAGDYLIVRYYQIREFFERGEVELIL